MSAPVYRLSLAHRHRPAPKPVAGRQPLLLLLHGYGSNEDDLIGLAPYLDPRFAMVSARAPQILAHGSYAWFPIDFDAGGVRVRPDDARQSIDRLMTFIPEAISAYRSKSDSTIVMGFSQGATMAGAALLMQPDLFSGAVLMSGFIMPGMVQGVSDASGDGPLAELVGKPVLITHGWLDAVVPVAFGQGSRDLLATRGADVTYREYPMAHEVSDACIVDVDAWLGDWLESRLAARP
jgi:phospholipase/carboxylesterase